MAKAKDITTEIKDQEIVQDSTPSLMVRFFAMVLELLSLKVQCIRVHQPVLVHGDTKNTVDVDMQKCKMILTPFGILIYSTHPKKKIEMKTLVTFNNMYSIEFVC